MTTYFIFAVIYILIFLFPACDPKLMPSFPQHRNMKGQQKSSQSNQLNIPLSNLNTGANDQTNNLPAISDLLGSLVKKRRLE